MCITTKKNLKPGRTRRESPGTEMRNDAILVPLCFIVAKAQAHFSYCFIQIHSNLYCFERKYFTCSNIARL